MMGAIVHTDLWVDGNPHLVGDFLWSDSVLVIISCDPKFGVFGSRVCR